MSVGNSKINLEEREVVVVEFVLSFVFFKCEKIDQFVNQLLLWKELVDGLFLIRQFLQLSTQFGLLISRGIDFQKSATKQKH